MPSYSFISTLTFNQDGLIPVITQDEHGNVLMMAWMNKEALEETLTTQKMCYFSRSRQSLWRKGERSGQTQRLKELRIDCDSDTLLAIVEQKGVACHTGRRSCFYKTVHGQSIVENQEVITPPDALYTDS